MEVSAPSQLLATNVVKWPPEWSLLYYVANLSSLGYPQYYWLRELEIKRKASCGSHDQYSTICTGTCSQLSREGTTATPFEGAYKAKMLSKSKSFQNKSTLILGFQVTFWSASDTPEPQGPLFKNTQFSHWWKQKHQAIAWRDNIVVSKRYLNFIIIWLCVFSSC
jgi:hypothetical protein